MHADAERALAVAEVCHAERQHGRAIRPGAACVDGLDELSALTAIAVALRDGFGQRARALTHRKARASVAALDEVLQAVAVEPRVEHCEVAKHPSETSREGVCIQFVVVKEYVGDEDIAHEYVCERAANLEVQGRFGANAIWGLHGCLSWSARCKAG